MAKSFKYTSTILMVALSLWLSLDFLYTCAHATAGNTLTASGSIYEFEENAHYEFSGAKASTKQSAFGTLSIMGNAIRSGTQGTFPRYTVESGALSFAYSFDSALLNVEETEWHLISDKSKKVNDFELEQNILSGAVIVQSSPNGKTWITDSVITDAFTEDSVLDSAIYQTTDIQLVNGCYYRVIVVYKLQKKTGDGKFLFVIPTKETESKKVAEVYEFYAVSKNTANSPITIDTSPRRVLGQDPIKVKTDSGYSENPSTDLDKDDPHFNWKLGYFVVNGYTREANETNGVPVFLKTIGDQVTLWFYLNQDINCLNGNENLTISEDSNGYDQHFGIPQTNFKHGTLIIQYTDYEGNKHDPVIYTDFLAANAVTKADTRVLIYEEGDYEVSLDYEIKNDPRKVGPFSIVPTYSNYKLTFRFSVYNGNSMVYIFDDSGEIKDKALAPNGFKLDLANSKYLTIDISRSDLSVDASTGLVATDVRTNSATKDQAEYHDEGIYTITVQNLFTNETTTKTIYVGQNKHYKALSKNKLTVEELNKWILQGAIIDDDGNISYPAGEPEPEPTPEPTPAATPEPISTPTPDPQPTPATIVTDIKVEYSNSMPASVFYVLLCLSLAVVIGFVIVVVKRRQMQDEYVAPEELDDTLALPDGGEQKIDDEQETGDNRMPVDKPTDADHQ